MFCKNCGKDIGDAIFCPYCGTKNVVENNDGQNEVHEDVHVEEVHGETATNTLPVAPQKSFDNKQTILIVAKVFLILSMVGVGITFLFYLIAAFASLGVLLPVVIVSGIALVVQLILGIFAIKKIDNATSAKDLVGWAVVTLILVNLISGILMLCAKDN